MNPTDYMNLFWEEDSLKPFSPHETRLYFFLLSKWVNQTQGTPFECSTHYLETHLMLPKMTITRCRDKLAQRGLIQYVKGDRKLRNPYYFLCGVTNHVTNHVTNSVTNHVTNPKEEIPPTPPKEEKIEREKENISKDIQKKEESGLSFCLPSYMPIMEEWLEYKKEKKQKYTDMGIRACYHNLVKLSNNSPEIAKLIVEQSIANNWAGLFELKTNGRTQENFRITSRPGFNNFDEAESKQVGRINSIEL